MCVLFPKESPMLGFSFSLVDSEGGRGSLIETLGKRQRQEGPLSLQLKKAGRPSSSAHPTRSDSMSTPKFKAASKAGYANLADLARTAVAKVPAPPVPKGVGGPVGKAKAKALATGADGALNVRGSEVTAASMGPFSLEMLCQKRHFMPFPGLAIMMAPQHALKNLPAAQKHTNEGAPLGPWQLAVTMALANAGAIPPRFIRAERDDFYEEVNNYSFLDGCDLLGIDTSGSEEDAVGDFEARAFLDKNHGHLGEPEWKEPEASGESW